MKLQAVFKIVAIFSYLCIFLQGMIIALPMVFILFVGLAYGETSDRVFIFFADVALCTAFVQSFTRQTRRSLLIDTIAFFLLSSLLIKILTSAPLYMFNYFLFIGPTTCFMVLYPLSLLLSFMDMKRLSQEKKVGLDFSSE